MASSIRILLKQLGLKRVFTLYAFAAIFGVATYASDRTDAEMRSIAGRQLFGAVTRGAAETKDLTLEMKDNNLSIYSAEGRGFVVVSRDNTFPAVLGLSSTAIDMNNLPEGFSWWLQEASRSLQARLEKGEDYARTRSDITVKPFLTTKWDQVNPYNLMCPKIGTSYCPTGCVATAAAQIMKYYNYPAQGHGIGKYEKDGTPQTKEISGVYNWANMKNTYSNTQTTLTDQTRDIATLMADVGAACGMKYTSKYGSAALDDCASALVNNFRYDSLSLSMCLRYFYDDVEWKGIVYNELANKRPILYAGTSDKEKESSGHAFVFHGLNGEGLVYVNWGWSGTCDGYYDIDLLQPGQDAAQKGDYSANAQMIIGFNPTSTPSEDVEERSFWGTDTICSFFVEKNHLILKARGMYNYNYRYFRGQLLVALENINGVEADSYNVILYDTEEKDRAPVPKMTGFTFNSEDRTKYSTVSLCDLKSSKIKAGTYIVTLASQALYESEISPMRYFKGVKCQAKLVKGKDGSIELTDLMPTAIKSMKSEVTHDSSKIYDLHGRSLGTDGSSLRKGIYIVGGKLRLK